jgi:hypothetical protein
LLLHLSLLHLSLLHLSLLHLSLLHLSLLLLSLLLLDKPWSQEHNQPLSPGHQSTFPAKSPDPKEVVYDHPFRTLGRRSRSRHRRVRRNVSRDFGGRHRHHTANRFER